MFIFYFFVNLLIVEKFSTKFIILPFKEIILEYNESEKNIDYTHLLINNYLEYKIMSELKIGTPPKIIPFSINPNIKIFRLRIENSKENKYFDNYEKYIPFKSSSFKNISKINNLEPIPFFNYYLTNETIKISSNRNDNIETDIKDIQIFLENLNYIFNKELFNESRSNFSYTYGEIGFSTYQSIDEKKDFLFQLKNLGIINSTIFTFEYEKGLIYIGEYPHIYDNNKYNEEMFMTAYTYPEDGYITQLKLRMNRLYIIDENKEYIHFENNIIIFNYCSGVIISTKEYYNKIKEVYFNKYINLEICKENIEVRGRNNYYIISCKKSEEFKIEEFPTLYLFKEEFKYIFELNYKDLFKEVNNIYYFLVIYFPFFIDNFELGKPFLKKYQITYNAESNTIHYYNELLNKNKQEIKGNKKTYRNKNKNIFILIFLLGIIIIFIFVYIFFYITKKIYQKRKLRTNELDDEYDYSAPSNNEN